METGIIHLRGRLKEIIVTSTGEKVAPVDLELLIVTDPLVDHVMVVGEARPYLAALLVPRRRLGKRWPAKMVWIRMRPPLSRPRISRKQCFSGSGDPARLSAHAQIRAVALLRDEWSIANGLLTPTLKLKRAVMKRDTGK